MENQEEFQDDYFSSENMGGSELFQSTPSELTTQTVQITTAKQSLTTQDTSSLQIIDSAPKVQNPESKPTHKKKIKNKKRVVEDNVDVPEPALLIELSDSTKARAETIGAVLEKSNRSPLGDLPPLPQLKATAQLAPLVEVQKRAAKTKEDIEKWWQDKKSQTPVVSEGQNSNGKQARSSLKRYDARMQPIQEAEDAQFEESVQAITLNQIIEKANIGVKLENFMKIADTLRIREEDEGQQNAVDEEKSGNGSAQQLLDGDKVVAVAPANEGEELQLAARQVDSIDDSKASPSSAQESRSSQSTQQKLKNQLHQILSYHTILGDGDLQKSIIRQYDYQRQAFWRFEGEELADPQTAQNLKVLTVTWNLQGTLPDSDLRKLLLQSRHHVIAIGTQECQRSIPASLFISGKEKWEKMIQDATGQEYVLLQTVTMNAMHLAVLVHLSLAQSVNDLSCDSEATGIANIIGNKGGLAIALKIARRRYLFINSHFASGQKNTEKRNSDARKIGEKFIGNRGSSADSESKEVSNTPPFDYVFWMGDMNYRIGSERERVIDMIEKKQFIELLLVDQLLLEKEKGKVMLDFHEGVILFPPTYKLQVNSNEYSTDEDARVPGWTDRILFAARNACDLEQVNYDCAINMFGSDHRPVFAQFLCAHEHEDLSQALAVVKGGTTSVCEIF